MMRPEMYHYYSRGKLLLTGEYLVLYGALSLAVPLRLGQHMHVKSREGKPRITWNAKSRGKTWFHAEIYPGGWKVDKSSDNNSSSKLVELLKAASQINPAMLDKETSWQVETDLEFDLDWGLGSSSSLISNVAYWFDIDPFSLFRKTTTGSGYDVFAARADSPLWYRLNDQDPVVREAAFDPPFRDQIYFIYLGVKKRSEESIARFRERGRPGKETVEKFTRLTEKITSSTELVEFEDLVNVHEKKLSQILGMKSLKENKFPDFKGSMKSLGAWGGDFAMVTWRGVPEDLQAYLLTRGIDTVFKYNEIVVRKNTRENVRKKEK